MNPTIQLDPRPEAMSDVPGVCELTLTRALVQYRDLHETDAAGGRVQDIGMALVLDGRYASASESVDLGSGDVKVLDLSGELVVLDWVYEPTLEHMASLVREVATSGDRRPVERFGFRLALRVLERLGFGPLTRPTLLRIGFRDICRDLDLHEGTSVRIVMGKGSVVRAHLDYDGNALVFRTASSERNPELELALEAAFPAGDLRRLQPASPAASGGYQVRFPLPLSLRELSEEMALLRQGFLELVGRFEPGRLEQIERLSSAFGSRETLALVSDRGGASYSSRIAEALPGDAEVHPRPRRAPSVSDGAFGSGSVN